jgi:Ni,Fe-hydrogenase III small subunit
MPTASSSPARSARNGTALVTTYEAVGKLKLVIAVGACAISGGLYHDRDETRDGIDGLFPVAFIFRTLRRIPTRCLTRSCAFSAGRRKEDARPGLPGRWPV